MKLVIDYCLDYKYFRDVVECDSFTIDKSGNFEPLIKFFDSEGNEIKSISLSIGNFHVFGKEI